MQEVVKVTDPDTTNGSEKAKNIVDNILGSILNNQDMASNLGEISVAELLKKLESDEFHQTAKFILLGLSISELLNRLFIDKSTGLFAGFTQDPETLEVDFRVKYELSKDEVLTLKMISEGLTNQQIADKVGTISIEGVKKRVPKILEKLGVNNRVQAAVTAAKEGIL